MEDMTIRQLHLRLTSEREMLAHFLASHHLKLDDDVECAFGIFDAEEALAGCGCAAGSLLKCFAIGDELRGQNGLGALISRLSADRFMQGFHQLFVFTRPHNRELFAGCGFVPLAETERVLLLENNRSGLPNYLKKLPRPAETEDIGAIVMNCNPLTNGHLALIRHAAEQCEYLYLFVVEENRSAFPFADRLALVREGTADLPNVQVCPSGPYMISSSTFPTYFLKETESPSALQSELDITLFGSRIAPELGIRRRFAGEEPFDTVTRQYNETMARLLPGYGVEFCEIPRKCLGDEPISASRVRKLLKEHDGVTQEIRQLVPTCTADYLTKTYGEGTP